MVYSNLTCHKRRNFSHFNIRHYPGSLASYERQNTESSSKATPFMESVKSKLWLGFSNSPFPSVLIDKGKKIKPTHYSGITDPKIFHKLCSSDWVSSALLIHSNEVMLLVATHLLVTRHWRQFFPFCELTSHESTKNTGWPEGNLPSALIIHKCFHPFFSAALFHINK